MATLASFSISHENGQCQQIRTPRKPIYSPIRFQENPEKKISKKKVVSILIGNST